MGRKAIFFIMKINIAFRDILATLIYMKNILKNSVLDDQSLDFSMVQQNDDDNLFVKLQPGA